MNTDKTTIATLIKLFEINMVASTDNSVKCKICKEKIHKYALKCTHCGSFQNWRRHLGLSTSFLSILVALISVLTVFITIILDSSIKNDSDISASVINWQRTYFIDQGKLSQVLIVEIFITNSGKKPGAMKAFSIKGAGENKFQYLMYGAPEIKDESSNIEIMSKTIEPGNTLLLKANLKTLLTIKEFEDKYSNADLKLEIVNFSGKEQDIIMEVKNSPPIFFK